MNASIPNFWSIPAKDVLNTLNATSNGLNSDEAAGRLKSYGANTLKRKGGNSTLMLLVNQFKSPIIIILLIACILSFSLSDPTDAIIILAIVLASGLLGFWQEKGASDAISKLLAIVQIKANVIRDGKQIEIPTEQVVPGDIVILNAGDAIPADGLIIESKDLFVDEATLTGETFPAEKKAGVTAVDTLISHRDNMLFMGTHVVSGTATAVMVSTGVNTEFGKISDRLKSAPALTDFEIGIKKFGYLLMQVTLVLVVIIFATNVFLHKPVLDSFLFSLALAVGLTPQLLPAIISINLSHGAKRMAEQKVIVKRLSAIENFGSMNVFCSDKTGTITAGVVTFKAALTIDNKESDKVLLYAYLNSVLEAGFANPIDEAIRKYKQIDISAYKKIDEVPYDFFRKRLSILVNHDSKNIIVTKGALQNIIDVCTFAENADGTIVPMTTVKDTIQKRFEDYSSQGFRTLGVAYKDIGSETVIDKTKETGMTFLGFLTLFDPPKEGIIETIKNLKNLGISMKVITGDNPLVAMSVAKQIGMINPQLITGGELRKISDSALAMRINDVTIFAEVEPNQKERIITALKSCGNVVGYMGDGINDAPALHAADVGISVDDAVDVAKEAADIVLMEKDLSVLINGVEEGRRTFANTMKYIFMATSANFGNMFSMAGASLFLNFLPLLPKQILLTNLMTDFPEMTIATDSVDTEAVQHPRKWDIKFIRNFMIVFGAISSIFDYITFGVLLYILKAKEQEFQTGWFLESVVSAAIIVLVVRTRKPFYKSKPGKHLLIATLIIVIATFILPYTPLGTLFGFVPLPISFLFGVLSIVAGYIIMAEIAKKQFYKFYKV